jgi:alkylation response protein AidB-like acyl-CoA dehydrogenase
MDFSLTEEQQMLKDSISKFVQNDYDFDTRRAIVDGDQPFSSDNWNLFAELGWLCVPFTEEHGGLGGYATDLMVVMEELGKGLVIEPFLATAVMSGGLIAAAGNSAQQALLEQIIGGELQMAFAYAEPHSRDHLNCVATTATANAAGYTLNGHKAVVLTGGAADKLIVAARTGGAQLDETGISLFIVDANAPGITRQSYKTQDGFGAADIRFDNVSVDKEALLGEEGQALPHISAIIDRATLAICAEAVGAAEMSYTKTVEYTKIRKQFGVPIAKFQALQHRMAEMFMEHEQAKSILLMAAMKMDSGDDVSKMVSAAKSRIGRAIRLIGQESVQIHGGIGVTDELDVGHYFKRLTMIEALFGNSDFHTTRFANS